MFFSLLILNYPPSLSCFGTEFEFRLSLRCWVVGLSTSWYVLSRLNMMLSDAICFVCLHNHQF